LNWPLAFRSLDTFETSLLRNFDADVILPAMIRLTEGAVALAVGAGDAFIEDKGNGPGGIPWVVFFDAIALAGGLFGDKVGLSTEIRDPLAFAALATVGARLTDAAQAGKLAQGPKAWGSSLGAYSSGLGAMNAPPSLPANAAASIRLLPGRSASQSAFSMSPTLFEAAGVTG
jgi:hypothetical protein